MFDCWVEELYPRDGENSLLSRLKEFLWDLSTLMECVRILWRFFVLCTDLFRLMWSFKHNKFEIILVVKMQSLRSKYP